MGKYGTFRALWLCWVWWSAPPQILEDHPMCGITTGGGASFLTECYLDCELSTVTDTSHCLNDCFSSERTGTRHCIHTLIEDVEKNGICPDPPGKSTPGKRQKKDTIYSVSSLTFTLKSVAATLHTKNNQIATLHCIKWYFSLIFCIVFLFWVISHGN